MENENNMKTPRASQSRVSEKRPTTWTPPSSLDAPPAPDGFRHRWIRTETLGMDDSKNMSGKVKIWLGTRSSRPIPRAPL
jgi:hypothetical protein